MKTNSKQDSITKTALITGGSSGLGLALARNLGRRGYRLLSLARDCARLDRAVEQLQAEGFTATGFRGDITREEQLRQIRSGLEAQALQLDCLVLNAGVVSPKLLQDFPDTAALRHDLEINLWGTILCAYIFLPLVKPGGRILVVSSAFGLMGPAAYAVYAASKAGLINFAESLRRELLGRRITVHVACPADIDTPQLHREHQELPDWFTQGDPRRAMSAQRAAERILRKCFRGVFLIIISFEIHLLNLMNKLLPRRLRDFCLDRMFPTPGKQHNCTR